ncbi:MAG: ADP-glyceromanno-heptose 6-epimerase [Bacteroidota bacterium]
MDRNAVIIVTGAAGFIGSCLTGYLNRKGYYNIIIVDDFNDESKRHNYDEKKICARVDREELFDWLNRYKIRIDFIFHLGAQTNTDEPDYSVYEALNVEYSKKIWNYCTEKNIPLVYASSDATYGAGEQGYDDNELPEKLKPINSYGISKNEFDKWALAQSKESNCPPFWAGLKFFNVYGPNEYHKGAMASAILHSFQQVCAEGKIKLFKSYNPGYKNGGQSCDFVYVKDVVDVCYWLMQKSVDNTGKQVSGLFNVGTGTPRTFDEMAGIIFKVLERNAVIEYADEPPPGRDDYNQFIKADITRLREAGYRKNFYSLEDGVKTYVQHFLLENKYY